MKTSKSNTKKKFIISILAVLLALIIASAVYVNDYYHADVEAMAIVDSAAEIDGNMVFAPENPTAGVIFYPGGKVQAQSYAPLLRKLSENNILCVLVPMPANLAVLGMNKADGIMENFPEIDSWYMAGHSLGGAMASSYISENAADFAGLILLAAYSTEDLTAVDISVLSIYGENDGVLNRQAYEQNLQNLPDDYTEVIIQGGCHAYFGSYGEQDGDGAASITRQEQIDKTVDAIVGFVK